MESLKLLESYRQSKNHPPYLEEKNLPLGAILEALHNGVLAVTLEQRIVLFNQAAERILGLKAEEVLGRPWAEVFPFAGLIEVLTTGEYAVGLKLEVNGRQLLTNRSPVWYEGRLVGAVAVFQPLGEIEALSPELEAVRRLNLQLEGIIESSYDGIGVVDHRGYLIRVNRGYERVTGLKREEVVGRHLSELVDKGIISVAPSLTAIQEKRRVTAFQQVKTGAEVLITASPLFGESGEIALVIGNIRDVSDLNRLKEENARYKDLSRRYQQEARELRSRQRVQEEVIAHSGAMRRVVELALRAAQASCSVLITGETGVGKEVVARLIHYSSPRAAGPFLQINCAAIPPNLLESELFGYESGAFSGAAKGGKTGLLEMANHGSILLDEIGEMPLELQAKLLRVLQDQVVYRVGGTRPLHLDVRVLAATNMDLEERIAEHAFRRDLFYRLNVVPIAIPPLRERREDILPLALAFLRRFNEKYRGEKRLALGAQEVLENYPWPGNVRELENLMERLVVMAPAEVIAAEEISLALGRASSPQREGPEAVVVNELIPLDQAYGLLERKLLEKALDRCKSARQVARVLGVSHPTVIKKVAEYGLAAPWAGEAAGRAPAGAGGDAGGAVKKPRRGKRDHGQ